MSHSYFLKCQKMIDSIFIGEKIRQCRFCDEKTLRDICVVCEREQQKHEILFDGLNQITEGNNNEGVSRGVLEKRGDGL